MGSAEGWAIERCGPWSGRRPGHAARLEGGVPGSWGASGVGALPVSSGCVSEPEVIRRFNVRIPLREGITLSADLALPGSLPAPAVVLRTPYGKAGERQSKLGAVFAKAGY